MEISLSWDGRGLPGRGVRGEIENVPDSTHPGCRARGAVTCPRRCLGLVGVHSGRVFFGHVSRGLRRSIVAVSVTGG
ncbi:unnamed protein product, partial [Ectocarpus sp. 8 AP-2014]